MAMDDWEAPVTADIRIELMTGAALAPRRGEEPAG